jgi:cell division GTPase FtsZ
MKLLVVGLGQCGGRLADEFARMNGRARSHRNMTIVTGAFAINSDTADLSCLTTIPKDPKHRILIGGYKTSGHGVGKVNELGAEIARMDVDKIINAIRNTKHFFETDAFLLMAGAAGGTGSGAISVVAQYLKERYIDKPVYTLVVLPFEHEESTEERTVYNVATCLKSCNSIADAVILVDNQRYVRKDSSVKNNLTKINSMIAAPFYNLLCAGEEKKSKYIGAKIIDAGDIIHTMAKWTAIGYGKVETPVFKWPNEWGKDFRKKGIETHRGIQAMDEAISELSLECNPADARRAIYIVSGPSKEMNMDMIKEIGEHTREIVPDAIIRNGDYPRERGLVDVTIVLSELSVVKKVKDYYFTSTFLVPEVEKRQEETRDKLRQLDDASKSIPSLLQ